MTEAMSCRGDYTIRPATVDDIDVLINLRLTMFRAMGFDNAILLEHVAAACQTYFEQHLPTALFRAWVAEAKSGAVASIGLVMHSIPPSPRNLVGLEGYLMNLVTLPRWRCQGIARALLTCVIEILREEGIPIISLHASADGRQLYESLGFTILENGPEMVLKLTS